MATGFVIMSIHYEYNDEVYHTTESDAGKPLKVFTDEAQAQKYADRLNVQELRGLEIGSYTYDLDDIQEDPEAFEAWFKKFGVEVNDAKWNLTVPKEATDTDLLELYNMITLEFYTVVPTEMEE